MDLAQNTLDICVYNASDALIATAINDAYNRGVQVRYIASKHIQSLISKINLIHKVKKNVEITLELNPDDISEEKIKKLKSIGINRLSIGVQSFYDEDLKFMNRSHNSKQALESIKLAQKNGLEKLQKNMLENKN